MRHILYLFSVTAMLAAAFGLAMLVRIASHPLWFAAIGAFLSTTVAMGWLVSRASAVQWPSLRTGKVLMVCGMAAALYNLWQGQWLAASWSALVFVSGVGFAVRIFPAGGPGRSGRTQRSQVQPPVSRREQV